jgi:hypothetical protein
MLLEKIQLETDEKIITTVRKHWFIIFAELFGIFIIALIPFFLVIGFIALPENIERGFTLTGYTPIILYTLAGWWILSIMVGAMIWTHYYLDLWIITDCRIIVIEQIQFFNRKISSFRLERLQDIKVSINGIIATFLNFGTIRAQTASAAESNFMSAGLPDPRGLQALIQESMDARLRVVYQNPVEKNEV